MAGNWAGALEALGAGLQGKGNEYMLVQEERKKRLDELDEERLKAMAMDFNSSLSDLKAGNTGAAWERLLNRHEQIIQLGGDPTHTENLIGMLKSGDVNGAVSKLEQARAAAIQDGLIEGDKRIGSKGGQVFYEGPNGPYAKAIQGFEEAPTEKQKVDLETSKVQLAAAKLSVEQVRAEIAKINREAQGLPPDEREIIKTERKETLKNNVNRITELSEGAKSREAAIKRAEKFRNALKTGEASSGASREILGLIPGAFTDQAKFDEEFNAFAEVAARQKLKAAGETRPTDADVEGMKRAMFGIGRDETVNVELLDQFISEQRALDEEFSSLVQAKEQGALSEFSYTPDVVGPKQNNGPSMQDIEFTAKKYGMTVDQVKQKLGLQ